MLIDKKLYEEFMSIMLDTTELNAIHKMQEIIEHTAFKKDKMHIEIIKGYLNDDKIYGRNLEKLLGNDNFLGDYTEFNLLEVFLIYTSLFLDLYEGLFDQNEKKVLVVRFLDILNPNKDNNLEIEKCINAMKFLTNTIHVYVNKNVKYDSNNLKNIEFLSQILNILNNGANKLITINESTHSLFDKQKLFYEQKKEYFKEKHFIEHERLKNSDSKVKNENENIKPYANYTNVFNKKIPIIDAVNHFKIFTTAKSKNGKPFLTEKQFDTFIKKAFCGVSDLPKQKFNMAPKGEKLAIQYKFREYYTLRSEKFGTYQVRDKFAKLLTDNFIDWNFQNVINNFNHRPRKTI